MTLPTPPTIEQLTQEAATMLQQALLESQSTGETLTPVELEIARSNTKALAFVQGVGISGAYQYLVRHIAKQAIPTKATGTFQDDWLNSYGMPRKPGQFASGKASGTGPAGAVLEAGETMRHANGYEYMVVSDAMVDVEGNITVTLECTIAGMACNLLPGETLTLLATDTDINASFTVDESGITGGTDRESEAEAAYRLQHRLANPPGGSAPADYERWAMSVSGITRAWGVRAPFGGTTAGVIIVADNNPDHLPTEEQRQAVYDYIRDRLRGPPDELFVIIPTLKYLDGVLALSPDTVANRNAVLLELQDLFFREVIPGRALPIAHITGAVSAVSGVYNYTMFEPEPVSGSVLVAGPYEMFILRDVTFLAPEEITPYKVAAAAAKAAEIVSGGGDG